MSGHLPAAREVICGACTSRVSVFRIRAHQRSESCRITQRARAAKLQLLKHGDFDDVRAATTVRIGGRVVRVLAVGVDRIINAVTIVDMDGNVRQYISGEWSEGGKRAW